MFDLRFRSVVFGLAVVALSLASGAVAQQPGPVKATGERVSEAAAIAFLDAFFASRPRVVVVQCGARVRTNDPITYEMSSDRLRVANCGGELVRDFAFVEYPYVDHRGGGQVCVSKKGNTLAFDPRFNACIDGILWTSVKDVQGFANAWLALAHPPPRDPASDAAFQAALAQVRAKAEDRTEQQRRAQVQVEALVAASRNEDAAKRYREELGASPDWADGHYNLALLAGELGKHVEAITEMKRYLYLRSDAPDARAAQDQIYKWEALLTP